MFKSIKAKNFLSWESLDFQIPKGITLIEGKNHDDTTSEGSGKSAILNALCWGLFGKIPKNVKANEIIKEGASGCEVQIELQDGSTITRSRNPNKVFLIDPSGKVIEGADIRESQKIIEDHLQLDFDVFCQSIYFPQNYAQKFITSTPEQKVQILSSILHTDVFDSAYKQAKLLSAKKEMELNNLLADINNLKSLIKNSNVHLKDLKEFLETKVDEDKKLNKELLDLEKQIRETKLTQEKNLQPEIDNKEKELKKVTEDLNSRLLIKATQSHKNESNSFIKEEMKSLENEIAKLQTSIIGLNSNIKKTCPTCGSEVSNEAALQDHKARVQEEISAKKAKYESFKSKLVETKKILIVNIDNSISSLRVNKEKLEKELLILRTIQEKSKSSKIILDVQEAQKEKTKLKITTNLKSLEDMQSKVKNIETTIQNSENDLTTKSSFHAKLLLDRDNYLLLSKYFKEVKKYTFNKLLEVLSLKTNNYLKKLFKMPIELLITNTDEDGVISKIDIQIKYDGKERSLDLFSGGQLRRIQLSVDLALSDIICSKTGNNLNLLILDEVFKDLSLISQERMLKLLQSLDKNILLIEHSDLFKSIITQSVMVELVNGTSRFC